TTGTALDDLRATEGLFRPLHGDHDVEQGDVGGIPCEPESAVGAGNRNEHIRSYQRLELLVQVGSGQLVEPGQPGGGHRALNPGQVDTGMKNPLDRLTEPHN